MHTTTLLWGVGKGRYHKEPYAQEMKKRLLLRTGASKQPTDGVGEKNTKTRLRTPHGRFAGYHCSRLDYHDDATADRMDFSPRKTSAGLVMTCAGFPFSRLSRSVEQQTWTAGPPSPHPRHALATAGAPSDTA